MSPSIPLTYNNNMSVFQTATVNTNMIGPAFSAMPAATINTGAQVFELFDNLPLELKTKIWREAINSRVILAVEVIDHHAASDPNCKDFSFFKVFGAPYPTIFQVCREVRGLAGTLGYKALFRTVGSDKAVYFNPMVDRLEIHSDLMKNGIPAQLELGLALKNPGDLELVRYLSMPITSFESQHHWAMANLNNMPALRGLSLSGLVHSRTPYPQYTLKFGFVDSDESSDTKTLLDQMLRDGVSDDDVSPLHMLAQTRMLILPQLEVACQEKFRHEFQDAFQFIPGYSEQNYLYFLWRLIIEATSKSKHFSPKGVEVAIEYMQIPSPAPVARML